MPRTIQPELLDSLPPQHPDAVHNRRDLRWTNRLMGNYRWMGETLARVAAADLILELGAGEGDLCRQLWARGLRVDGLDLWPKPANWPASRTWHRADLRTFEGYHRYAVVFGNLILHQFTDDELSALGARLRASARVIVACEPMRRRLSQLGYRVLGPLFGANHVSLHDAHVSIDAGFMGDELPRLLGLKGEDWDVRCASTVRGAYQMVATRRP